MIVIVFIFLLGKFFFNRLTSFMSRCVLAEIICNFQTSKIFNFDYIN